MFLLIRRVQTESATGSVSSNKVRTTLAIAVEGIEFDTQACMLRIKGRNVEENQYVKVCEKGKVLNNSKENCQSKLNKYCKSNTQS